MMSDNPPSNELVRNQPSQTDVGRNGPEQRTQEGKATGGHRRQGAPGAGTGSRRRESAQLAGRLAADEADAHREDAQGECDAEDGGPVHDLGRCGLVVLRLDA